jgi:hypothetical protein
VNVVFQRTKIMTLSSKLPSHSRHARKRGIFWLTLHGLFCILLLASGLSAGSIFDDDFVPPKVELTTNPPADSSSSKPPINPSPAIPVPTDEMTKNPTTNSPAADATSPASRRPVPAPAAQAKSRKLFKELYAKELSDKSPAARRALAEKLLSQAASVSDAPADEFVLLVGATQAGKEASDFAISCQAADTLAEVYDLDGLRYKTDLAMKISLRGATPSATTQNCTTALRVVDELLADGDDIAAMRLLQSLRAAGANGDVNSQIQERIKTLESIRSATDRVAPFQKKLSESPDDPAANLAVGEYLCFMKADWKRGLPLLAKSGKPAITAAATLDLASAANSDRQIDVGDAWWDAAEKEAGPNQSAMRQHAANYYVNAVEGGKAPGLKRAILEKRIATVWPSSPPAAPPHVTILTANYGDATRKISIAKQIQQAIEADPFKPICPADGWGGDPAPGAPKTLSFSYRIDTRVVNVTLKNDEIYLIPPIPAEGVAIKGASILFRVVAARYGARSNWIDSTDDIRKEILDRSQSVKVRNMAGRDLAEMTVKKLVVWFEFRGRRYVHITAEGDSMTLTAKEQR